MLARVLGPDTPAAVGVRPSRAFFKTKKGALAFVRKYGYENTHDVVCDKAAATERGMGYMKPWRLREKPTSRTRKNPSRRPSGLPQVFAVDLSSYVEGRTRGGWVDLTGVQDGADVEEALREVVGNAEEIAIHDYEGMPSLGEHPSWDDLAMIAKAVEEHGETAVDAALELFHSAERAVAALEGGYGEFEDEEAFGYDCADSFGIDSLGREILDSYFDYRAFGRDVRLNGEDDGYDESLSDRQLGEQIVDDAGGVDALGPKTVEMYFDYASFGRDVMADYPHTRRGGNFILFWSDE
jgi:antirestriction protein